jgi:hypothetical protein
MLERPAKGSGASMRVKSLLILLSVTALGAYTVGRHSSPVNNAPVAQPQPSVVKPLAFAAPVSLPIAAATTSNATFNPVHATTKAAPEKPTAPRAPEKPAPPEIQRKAEIALTAAAIAAILIKASRDQYHATGRPCACPNDTMRNGRACGSRSAYSRPGGVAPLCYPSDVTPVMIESYKQRQVSRRSGAAS